MRAQIPRSAGHFVQLNIYIFPCMGRSWKPPLAVAWLIGIAATVHAGPVVSLLEIREHQVVVQKWDISCAAAALATVLRYQHRQPVGEKEVAQHMLRRTDPLRVKFRGGFSLLDLKRYVESQGLLAVGYVGMSLEDLIAEAPVIVPLRLRAYNHFVVFRGVQGDRVLLADPAFGNRTVTVARFREEWLKNMGFVVKDPHVAQSRNRMAPVGPEVLRPSDRMLQSTLR